MDEHRHQELLRLVREVRLEAKNPLTAALGHLQLALEDLQDADEEVRASLTTTLAELRRLSETLTRLDEAR
jgi:signal transduction histidine kinase